ncbi:MAG: hypothetical protein ACRDQD_04165 [Nocardioidaceae bacterium]
MTAMPEVIRVGPYRYRVVVDQAVVDASCRELQANLTGSADHVTQTISLSPNLGPDARAEVLLHECIHAIFEQATVRYDVKPSVLERLVELLGYAVLDLLRRNPELVAYLTAETDGAA